MYKHIFTLCLAASMCSCMDDMEFNKISDKVNVSPSILLPIATADVDVRYLFDMAENAVETYEAEDGTHRIRLRANHDSISSYSIFDLLGLAKSDIVYSRQFDWSSYNTKYITKDISLDASMSMPIMEKKETGIEITDAVLTYELNITYTDFEHPASLNFDFAGKKMTVEMKGSGKETFGDTQATISVDKGKLDLGITLNVPATGDGSLGKVTVEAKLKELNSISGSTSAINLPTSTSISLTHMRPFRRISRNMKWKNPQLWITCTNKLPLNGKFSPNVTSVGDKEMLLTSTTYEIPSGKVGFEALIDNKNSNIEKFFNNVPDTVTFDANIELTMPEGENAITLNRTDSIYLGYRYNVPFEFMMDTDFDCDTVEISEVPNMDHVLRAKFVSNIVNGLPCGISVVLQLMNTDKGETYSAIDLEDIAKMPEVNSNGVSTSETESVKSVELTRENINDLSKSNALIVRVRLDTGDQYICPKIEDRLQIDMSLAAEIDLRNE